MNGSIPADPGPADRSPGLLDRALRVFADVRPGEAAGALLMTFNLFLLLVGYYVAKTVREPLVLATGGAEMAAYASAVQSLVLMGFVPLYGWLASTVDRLRLITFFLLFFLACVELFNVGLRVRVPYLGFVFFVWVGIFSLATIAQFWSYANDVYGPGKGERLFPLIAIGATVGSPVGSKAAAILFERGVSPATMLHITAVLLLVHLVLYWVANDLLQRERARPDRAGGQPLAGPGGFTLVAKSRYLQLIAVLLVLLNVVNTTGEYIIRRSVSAAAEAAAVAVPGVDTASFIGSFYGDYFFGVNVAAVLIQAFLVSRLVKVAGLAGVLLALPLVSLGAYGLIAGGAAFTMVRWAKTAENATDYSVMNTARQMLWLPTTREEKYKAKQTLDTFFVRFGDMVSAGLVFAGTTWLALSTRGFAVANLFIAAVWIAVAVLVLREERRVRAKNAAALPAA